MLSILFIVYFSLLSFDTSFDCFSIFVKRFRDNDSFRNMEIRNFRKNGVGAFSDEEILQKNAMPDIHAVDTKIIKTQISRTLCVKFYRLSTLPYKSFVKKKKTNSREEIAKQKRSRQSVNCCEDGTTKLNTLKITLQRIFA